MITRSNTPPDGVTDAGTVTQQFWAQRDAILEIVAGHAAENLHLLGTMTRDRDVGATSDIAMVVAGAPDRTLAPLAGLTDEVSATCGLRVDVVTLEELCAERRHQSFYARRGTRSTDAEP